MGGLIRTQNVCTYTHTYIYTYIHLHIYTYIHIYIYIYIGGQDPRPPGEVVLFVAGLRLLVLALAGGVGVARVAGGGVMVSQIVDALLSPREERGTVALFLVRDTSS